MTISPFSPQPLVEPTPFYEFLYRIPVAKLLSLVYFACLIPIFLLALSEIRAWRLDRRSPKHCRKFGLESHSNLYDQYWPLYSRGIDPGKESDGSPKWRVKALMIHPIKSCKEVELHNGSVFGYGMQYDRQFCFAYLKPPSSSPDGLQEEQWTFLTRRDYAKLAQVKVEIWIPENRTWPSPEKTPKEVKSRGVLVVSFPNPDYRKASLPTRFLKSLTDDFESVTFHVPLTPPPDSTYPLSSMKIWKDQPQAINMGLHVPSSFAAFLGVTHPVTLFRTSPAHYREVYRCAPRKQVLGYQSHTGFADAYPLHIMNLASVHDVAHRVKDELPRLSAKRFRSNIIITGPTAYAEDEWKKIRIGKAIFYVVCRTARCKLPNVDPETGEKHKMEPDRVMRSFRQVDEGAKLLACLGMQMVPAKEESMITVGDEVEVLETGEHFYQRQ